MSLMSELLVSLRILCHVPFITLIYLCTYFSTIFSLVMLGTVYQLSNLFFSLSQFSFKFLLCTLLVICANTHIMFLILFLSKSAMGIIVKIIIIVIISIRHIVIVLNCHISFTSILYCCIFYTRSIIILCLIINLRLFSFFIVILLCI